MPLSSLPQSSLPQSSLPLAVPERSMHPAARPAVIDIGSNSIRLVVFDHLGRSPVQVVNEKVLCGLGRDLESTGRLNPDGVAQARAAIRRFARLLRGMTVTEVAAVATAAVRDAADGPEFLAAVARDSGIAVRPISGEDEALLSARGVLSGTPDADGVVGDLGGGSLELTEVAARATGQRLTLPLGPFRLAALGGRPQQQKRIDDALEALPFLETGRGRAFYAVGGAWRALAKAHMAHVDYPLHIIQHYAVGRGEIQEFAALIARQTRATLERVPGVSRRRAEGLPAAALVLERLVRALKPSQVVFSAFGLREGLLFERLDPAERAADPLMAAAADVARRMGRFGQAETLIDWTRPLFAALGETPAQRRLRAAVCLLSDLGWTEHPDYRAEHAFLRVLRMPFGGADHAARAWMALAIHARYGGDEDAPFLAPAQRLLDPPERARAVGLGLVLRLAHTLTGGVVGELAGQRLGAEDGVLDLQLDRDHADLAGEVVERRVEAAARALGCRAARISPPEPAGERRAG